MCICICLKKNLNASRSSEHPTQGAEMSKRLVGGIIVCKDKTSSWHLNGFPSGGNWVNSIVSGRSPPIYCTLARRNGSSTSSWGILFFLQQALSFGTRHLCRQGVALVSTRQLHSQGPMSVHAHCTEELTRSEGREGANAGGNG